MHETTIATVMETVHTLLREQFGRQAVPLEHDGLIQLMRFPGGSYMLVVRPCGETSLRVHQAVGTPDFDMPGLQSFLLSEHCGWIFGRLERDGDTLVVSHALDVSQLEGSLVQVVEAVHAMAVKTESLLYRVAALTDVDPDATEPDDQD